MDATQAALPANEINSIELEEFDGSTGFSGRWSLAREQLEPNELERIRVGLRKLFADAKSVKLDRHPFGSSVYTVRVAVRSGATSIVQLSLLDMSRDSADFLSRVIDMANSRGRAA